METGVIMSFTHTIGVMWIITPTVAKSHFKIDWAVDSEGNPVDLPGVDFIKIYTGVNQFNGWLGECSTEVMGVTDLHIEE